ncbi:MAG: recombinase RarA, partial [Spirochaetales bacterium]
MLTQAALYLATCPKSNSTLCFFDALKAVEEEEAHVPNHLRDSSRDSEGFGHGKGYMYPHAYKDHWVAQQYLPDTLNGRVFYNPGNMGYEKTIQQEVLSRRELYIAEMLQSENPHATEINLYNNPQPITSMSITAPQENLTFSPGDNKRTSIQQTWQQRTESNRTDFLLSVRNATVEHANILRHHRNLIMQADDGLLLWDIWRKSPEGVTAGICRNKENMHILMQYASTLETTDRPILTLNTESLCDIVFDRIFYKNPVTTKESIQNLVQELIAMQTYFAPQASIIISQNIPNKAQRLAHILTNNQTPYTHIPIPHNLLSAEEAFYTDNTNPLFNWTDSDITHAIQTALPTAHIENTDIIYTEKRHIPPQTIAKWFDTAQSPYATFMHTQLNDTHFKTLQTLFETAAQKPLPWKTHTTVYTVTLA